MAVVGNLQVILELNDGQFTTRVVAAGAALNNLGTQATTAAGAVNTASGNINNLSVTANIAATSVTRLGSALGSASHGAASWITAIGQARHAIENVHSVFGAWIEKIIDVNKGMERTQYLLAGFSNAATQAERLRDGMVGLNKILDMASTSPFSFGQLQDTFVKLKTAGIDPLAGSMRALIDATASFGGDDKRLQRASYAIQEMAGNGVVSLSNLRRQLGQDIPNSLNFMARSMALTIGELDHKVKRGTLESMNAIQLMMDEFTRAFGGAAAQRMQTFQGQIAQITTEVERLAHIAGGVQLDADPTQSSFKGLVEIMKQVVMMMRSNEAQAAAITLNNSLKSVTETIKAIIPYLPTFSTALQGATIAFGALASMILYRVVAAMIAFGTGTVAMATSHLTMLGVAAATTATSLAAWGATAVAWFSTAATAVAGFGTSLLASVAGVSAATAASTGLIGSIAGLGVGLVGVAVPVGIAAAVLIYLSTQLRDVRGNAALALESINRFKQGDFTDKNQAAMAKDIEALNARLALVLRMQKEVDILAQKGSKSLTGLQSIGGLGSEKGITAPSTGQTTWNGGFETVNRDQQGQITSAEEAFKSYRERLLKIQQQTNRALLTQQIATNAAAFAALNQSAERYSEVSLAAIEEKMQVYRTTYRDVSSKVDEDRKKIIAGDHHGHEELNKKQRANMRALYDAELGDLQQALAKEITLREGARAQGDTFAEAAHIKTIDDLRRRSSEQIKIAEQAIKVWGNALTTDASKDYDSQVTGIDTVFENTVGQIRSLQAHLDGLPTHVAKAMSWLEKDGKFDKLGGPLGELGQKLIYLMGLYDNLAERKKAFDDAQKAGDAIDTGFSRATANMAAALSKLENPNLSESERSFQQFAASMGREMARVGEAFDKGAIGAEEFMRRTNAALAAIDLQRNADLFGKVEVAIKAAGLAFENSLPGPEKAAAALARHLQNLKDLIELVRATALISPEIAAKAGEMIAQLENAMVQREVAEKNTQNRLGGAAARPGDNVVSQLEGRLAQLKGEITGTSGEYAKWVALIAASPAKYAGVKDKILELAKAIEEVTEQQKKSQAAFRAVENIKQRKADAQEEIDLLEELYQREGKVSAFEEKWMAFRIKSERELRAIRAAPAEAGIDVSAQTIQAAEADAAKLMALTQRQVLDNQKAERDIRLSFETTLSARRAAGMEEIEIERKAMEFAIAASNDVTKTLEENDARRRSMLERTASFYDAKIQELNRKTENGISKMAREWGDLEKQIGDFGAQAFSKLGDMMGDMLTKGKVDWASFTDFVIKSIIKIGIQAALSPLLSAIGGIGGSSGGGIGGILTSLLGNLFGGGGSGWSGVDASIPWDAGSGGINFAKGGEFPNGISDFHNQIVDRPTLFAFAAGAGLMGEAGPEAIMPLRRGADGSLGVVMHNSGNGDSLMQRAMHSIARAMEAPTVPKDAVHARSYSTPETRGAARTSTSHGRNMPATVNVHNQTSQPVQATAGSPRFDAEGMVLDIVIKAVQSPGPMRDAMRGLR